MFYGQTLPKIFSSNVLLIIKTKERRYGKPESRYKANKFKEKKDSIK
jgi:hypothetical protein